MYADDEEVRRHWIGWREFARGSAKRQGCGQPGAEIGTNLVKYGALSGGRPCRILVEACSGEHGEPPEVAPERRGFGYRLAELSVVSQLGGVLEADWLLAGGLLPK